VSWHGACNQYRSNPFQEVIMQISGENWRALSEAASREQDPERLIQLVEELNRVLLRQELERRRRLSAN
jgi:hypothetical protein